MKTGECACAFEAHAPKLVVLTGGPGAGKSVESPRLAVALCALSSGAAVS
jgi:hypothetical protein